MKLHGATCLCTTPWNWVINSIYYVVKLIGFVLGNVARASCKMIRQQHSVAAIPGIDSYNLSDDLCIFRTCYAHCSHMNIQHVTMLLNAYSRYNIMCNI